MCCVVVCFSLPALYDSPKGGHRLEKACREPRVTVNLPLGGGGRAKSPGPQALQYTLNDGQFGGFELSLQAGWGSISLVVSAGGASD